jgi:superoxide reductase
MKVTICTVCGHIMFGTTPDKCPVCFSEKDKFTQNDNIFKESKEKSPEGAIKHSPVITVSKDCKLIGGACIDITIKVGEVAHPMEEKHYIEFIDCYVDDVYVSRISLTPALYAAGSIHVKTSGSKFKAVEKCNIHGYWESESNI